VEEELLEISPPIIFVRPEMYKLVVVALPDVI